MEDNFFTEKNKVQSNWMKFKKVGDCVKGTLISINRKPAQPPYQAQEIIELLVKTSYIIDGEEQKVNKDGEYLNVGIGVNKAYVISRINKFKLGQVVGFKFTDLIKATVKGMDDAKSIEPFGGDMDPEYNKELIKNEMGGTEINEDEIIA